MSELRVEIPESIREYLSYNEETGDLTWIKGKRGTKKGSKAGCKHREYMVVKFEQKCFMYHNVCWYLKTGEQPCEFTNMITVDHINRNRITSYNVCYTKLLRILLLLFCFPFFLLLGRDYLY